MKPMRILMIGPNPQSRGGIATVEKNILNNSILRKRAQIEMWASYVDGLLPCRVLYSSVHEAAFRFASHTHDVYHIHAASGTSFWRKRRYIKALGERADKVILHIHGGGFIDFWDRCTLSQKECISSTFAAVGKVVVLSSEWIDLFRDRKICKEDKLIALPNAVAIPECDDIDYRGNKVLYLGRLDDNKSPDTLIRAAQLVLRKHPDARFTFAGDGDLSEYESLASTLGVAHACSFLGWVSGDELANQIRSSSIYCLPSKKEAMPMSLLEAMSYGLAAVATNQGSVPSVIKDNVTGRIMNVGDDNGLANILISLMDSPETRQRLGKSGRAYIESSYGMSSYSRRLIELYEEISQ